MNILEATIFGLDPSLRSTGISNGNETTRVETKPDDSLSPPADLMRRIDEIMDEVAVFINESKPIGGKIKLYVEAPMLTVRAPGSHLYEMGWYMSALHREYGESVIEVPSPTLYKFVTGKGRISKKDMGKWGLKRWHVDFENDPHDDKLFAYFLYQYGCAVRDGTHEHVPAKRRGAKRKV